ncbi:MAG: hypothetical protein IKG82_01640 [Oscillospiraceae bacterium]|nr:hypothetical protein [Oscillospiraceae bacterium]MBR3417374.1 hypothetical protein [Oscillospiraceae bacterium]
MGLSASCIFVRNPQQLSPEKLADILRGYMTAQGFVEAEASGADTALRLRFSASGQWFAVSPEKEDPTALSRCAAIAAGAFQEPVITAELVDSDFAELSLQPVNRKKPCRIAVGDPYGGRTHSDYRQFAAQFPDKLSAAQLREICEGGDVFAEDGLAALGTCLNLDITLLTENSEAGSAVLYFTKTHVPEAERTELYSGNILSMTEKPDPAAFAEQMVQLMSSAWELTETDTGRYIRIMETGSSLLLFSNLLYPKQLAACAGAPLIHISVAEQDIQTAVLQPNIMAKAQRGILPRTALPELLESAGTNEDAFREAALNGTGCTTLFFTGRRRPAGRIGLALRTLYETERFAYLYQNPDRLTKEQIIEKLDVFLAKVYGPKMISVQRLNPDSGEYEPVSYQDPGGICRTDKAHGEAYLRIFVNENGIALTGSLELPDNHRFAGIFGQNCLYLTIDRENGFAKYDLYAPDGRHLRSEMTDIGDCPACCEKFGFDPALPDAVYSSDAVVCWYSRPRDALYCSTVMCG